MSIKIDSLNSNEITKNKVKQTVLVMSFAALMIVAAYIRIPAVPVPFTLQTFVVILSAFIFGALHVVTGYESISDLLFILPYTSLGVAFALMYHKTKSVCTPAIMHIIHNTALVLISIFLAK